MAFGGWHVGCYERVVHGRQALLTIQDDFGSVVITAFESIDRLTRESLKVFCLCLSTEAGFRCSSHGKWSA